MLPIQIDRDSVHPGDDFEPHTKSITADPNVSLLSLLRSIRQSGYLPGIAEGEATWIIKSSGHGHPIGVLAQQWSEPELLVPPERKLQEHFGQSAASLHFTYWCQASPKLILASLREGTELPPKY
jgi:hypothetical protein